jgi:hypothetical protein
MEYRAEITKCYLVQVFDEEGNEMACEYHFVPTKKDAEKIGRELIEFIEQEDAK